MTDAEGAFRACLAAAPESAEAHYSLGLTLLALGDYAGNLALLERSFELQDDPTRRADLHIARFFAGETTRDDIVRRIASESVPNYLVTYLFALLDHPDPAQRDPELVLRTLDERASQISAESWLWTVETVARVRSEDWAGALAAIEGHYRAPSFLLLTPNAYDFLRALIYARLGRDGEARESYARGMAEWAVQTGGNPAAWERSDVMRWRREAEAAL
jgi:tetratricopeptide (TPR) repeat protein